MEMEENNTELEEGEACYYKTDDGYIVDRNIRSPDVDEKRLDNVLGQHRVVSKGSVTLQTTGTIYGGYGTFLVDNLLKEDAIQNLKAPVVVTSVRPGTASASHSAHLTRCSGLPCDNASLKQDSRQLSAQPAQTVTVKEESLSKPSNVNDQRTLKFRIKVGSHNFAVKKAAIYSGLGLDNSPSSSLGDSPEETGGKLPILHTGESPASILQDMTSFPLVGDRLMSPLHDSLINLKRKDKERFSENRENAPSSKASKGHSPVSGNAPLLALGNGEPLTETKVKLVGNRRTSVGLKHGNDMDSEKKMTPLPAPTKKLKNDTVSLKATGLACRVSGETTINRVRESSSSSELVKEFPESVSGQKSGKVKRQSIPCSSVDKISEQRAVNTCKNATPGSNDTTPPLRCKGDLNNGSKVSKKFKIGLKTKLHVNDETVTLEKEKPLIEGKKLNGIINGGKQAVVSMNNSVCEDKTLKDSSSDYSTLSKNKMHKMKVKSSNSVRDNSQDPSSKKLGVTSNQMGLAFEFKAKKHSHLDDISKQMAPSSSKPQRKLSSKNVGNKLIFGTRVKDVTHASSCSTEAAVASKVAPQQLDPVPAEDNWVACDKCQKWRLLPFGMTAEQLPDKWLCRMLDWLPGMNRCDISEDETTKATRPLLYQFPIAENRNSFQNSVNGNVSGVTPARVKYLDKNRQGLNFQATTCQEKKRDDSKELPKANRDSGLHQVLNSTKNHMHESAKRKRPDGMKRLQVESHDKNNFDYNGLDKSCDQIGEKSVRKLKETHTKAGFVQPKTIKVKRKHDNYEFEPAKKMKFEDGYENSKRTKTEDRHPVDKQQGSNNVPIKVGLSSNTGLLTLGSGKSMLQDNNGVPSMAAKCKSKNRLIVSVKKLGNRIQGSRDASSLGVTTCDTRDGSVKRRKAMECQDHVNGNDCTVSVKEESSDTGCMKEKKFKVAKEEGGVAQGYLSSSREHASSGNEKVTSVDKDFPFRNHRKLASKQSLVNLDSGRRDFAFGEALGTATSSSSKVSGFHKTLANPEEVKDSPMESVSSSPMRFFYREKHGSARDDTSRLNDAGNDAFSIQSKTNDGCSASEIGRDKMKVSNRNSAQKYLQIEDSRGYALESRPDGLTTHETSRNSKDSFPHKIIIKNRQCDNDSVNRRESMAQQSSGDRKGNQLKTKQHDDLGANPSSLSHTVEKTAQQQNLNRKFDGKSKLHPSEIVSGNLVSRSSPLMDDEDKQEIRGNKAVLVSKREDRFVELPVSASGSGDLPEGLKPLRDDETPNAAVHGMGHHTLNAQSSCDKPPTGKTAFDFLNKAKALRVYADHLKGSEFDHERNEACFQAVLNFLHGASLLENCTTESGRPSEMSDIQAYSNAAKLCELCANYYESHQDMASAAWAYKCIEVAYMRIVFCKHSTTSKDWNELQTNLQMVPQGESPSSSASDVDNLNNQAAVDKSALPRITAHATGSHVILARNRPKFERLLDITQDVNFAMEASRKSQNALEAANMAMEDAQNGELITYVKNVVDFSFQDVGALLRLVHNAREAMIRAGIGVARH